MSSQCRFLAALLRRAHGDERGQMLILAALSMVMVLGFGALSLDIGILIQERQSVQNAVDAGALAGGGVLDPNDSSSYAAAETVARSIALANDHRLTSDRVVVTFRCLVGDRNHDGQPDASDIPGVCDPGGNAVWKVAGGVAASPCVPDEGDRCNVIRVNASNEVNFFLAPVLGIATASTGDQSAAACKGACGGPPTAPVDLVIIIDRTSSMSSTDVTNARNAAKAVLQLYNPELQWVGLELLGSSNASTSCSGSPAGVHVLAASSAPPGTWPAPPIGLTGTGPGAPINESYLNADGTLNTSSMLVRGINCFNPSSTGTNLSAPVDAAASYLRANGRANARKGIILETDGSPNGSTCLAAYNSAQAAKTGNPSIEVFTVGFGVGSSDTCPDGSGPYRAKNVVQLLADMATSSVNNGCVTAENTDGDHFFCAPKTSDLSSIFQIAAATLAAGSHLVSLPE